MNNTLSICTYNLNLTGHVHHDYHQVLMPLFGNITIYLDNHPIQVHYGDGVLIPKNVYHRFQSAEEFRFLVMNITTDLTNIADFPDRHFALDQNILSYLNFLNTQLPITNNTEIEQTLFTLLKQLLSHLAWQEKIDRRLQNALHAMQQNPARHYTIANLANFSHISSSRFKQLFKAQLHCTPMAYLTRLRMQKAIGLLRHTDLPIGLIAEQCGYNNPSTFTRQFSRYFHQPPSQYRQS